MTFFTLNSVNAAPPTTEQLVQLKRQVKRSDYKISMWICAVAAGLVVATHLDDLHAMMWKVAAVLAMLPILLLLSATHKATCYQAVEGVERCAELYQACMQTEAGRAYYQAVLTQGRPFVNAELVMLKEASIHHWAARMASSPMAFPNK